MLPAPPDTFEAFATTAAAERERIVSECESHDWNDLPLHPWSHERHSLYRRLQALDLPGGDLDDLPIMRQRYDALRAANPTDTTTFEECVDWAIYLPAAGKVLYIAAHTIEEWFHLRAHPVRLLAAIQAWQEKHIAPEQMPAACVLAQRILSEHRQLIPMLKPHGKGTHNEAGNLPSP